MKGLGLDLTHICNLNCGFCWKFIDRSEFKIMTDEQVERFCNCFGGLKPKKLRITGGEPLMHPKFKEIISKLKYTFSDSIMQVTTNGVLLTEDLFQDRVQYVVTPYPENKEVIKKWGKKIIVYPRPRGYFNRNHDPNLSDARAKRVYKTCVYKQIRVIGDNAYDCCHAETIERIKGGIFHVKMEDWKEMKDNWRECIHCFANN